MPDSEAGGQAQNSVCLRSHLPGIWCMLRGLSPLLPSPFLSLSLSFSPPQAERTIGFMGVGFKSVYKRYARVTVYDSTWVFRFEEPATPAPMEPTQSWVLKVRCCTPAWTRPAALVQARQRPHHTRASFADPSFVEGTPRLEAGRPPACQARQPPPLAVPPSPLCSRAGPVRRARGATCGTARRPAPPSPGATSSSSAPAEVGPQGER